MAGIGMLVLARLGHLDLWDPDEANYAEIAREMAASGDWVVPHSNYRPYLEKPPLVFWAAALAMRVSGATTTAARLPAAISGLLLITAGALWARRALPPGGMLSAALVLATSLGLLLSSRVGLLDLPLTLCCTVAILGFERRVLAGGGRTGWWCFYLGMAAGCLAKGLIGVVLPVSVGALAVLWSRPRGLLRRLDLLPGVAILLAVTAPWFAAMAFRAPGFLSEFVLEHHVLRYIGEGIPHRRPLPIWGYVPLLALAGLPWTLYWPGAVADASRRVREREPLASLLFAAAGFPVLFFSLSATRLPQYILPAIPPLALLVARHLAAHQVSRKRMGALALAGAALFMTLELSVARPLNAERSLRVLAEAAAQHARDGETLLSYRLGRPYASVFYSRRRVRFIEEEVTFDQFIASPRRFWILIDEQERLALERRHRRGFPPLISRAGRHLITNRPGP